MILAENLKNVIQSRQMYRETQPNVSWVMGQVYKVRFFRYICLTDGSLCYKLYGGYPCVTSHSNYYVKWREVKS